MANEEFVVRLRQGIETWNTWRKVSLDKESPDEIDLSKAHLEGAHLRKANLGRANLREAHLQGAHLQGAHLQGADLTNADLTNADLREANLCGAYLTNAHLRRANLTNANLSGARLQGAHLQGAHLEGANLCGAYLTDANLRGANLTNADLFGAHLEGAHLEGAYLKLASFWEAILERAHFRKANLQEAWFWEANLREAILTGADLRNTHLEGANLEGANLEGANLEGANLEGANLEGANLEGANLEGVDLNTNFESPPISKGLMREEQKRRKNSLEISLLKPKKFAKGKTSNIKVQVYLPELREKAQAIINSQKIESNEDRFNSALEPNMVIIIGIDSQAISIGRNDIVKELKAEKINTVDFNVAPFDSCCPGTQYAVLYVKEAEANLEIESYNFSLFVDDYAFDHISKPKANYLYSLITGTGSLIIFLLTFFQQLDATLGFSAGTAAAAVASFYSIQPIRLYNRQSSTKLNNP